EGEARAARPQPGGRVGVVGEDDDGCVGEEGPARGEGELAVGTGKDGGGGRLLDRPALGGRPGGRGLGVVGAVLARAGGEDEAHAHGEGRGAGRTSAHGEASRGRVPDHPTWGAPPRRG